MPIKPRLVLATLLAAVAACSDATAPMEGSGARPRFAVVMQPYDGDPPPETTPPPPNPTVPEATPEELSYLPPEYRIETLFLYHHTDASFRGTTATAEGVMTWRGNRGEQELTMTVRGTDGNIERKFTSAGGNGFPWSENTLRTPGQFLMQSPCGNILDANTRHTIWNQMRLPDGVSRDGVTLGEVRWSTKEKTTFPLYDIGTRQPNCTTGGTGGPKPISNEGSTTYRCVTYTVEHYWYYPNSQSYEYRYTDTRTVCSGGQSTAGSGDGGEVAG